MPSSSDLPTPRSALGSDSRAPATATAFSHLEPYQAPVSANFEIPIHIGRLIAQWDNPRFSLAEEANFMRPDDYVVGLKHKGKAIAFPLWITDYYHVVNAEIEGDSVTFTTCERCQSGSAFIREIGEQEVRFSAMGMYNASLTMTDRANVLQRNGSLWLHYEGVCISGPHQGHFLPQLPTYHLTWGEWLERHPDSVVMRMPEDARHLDGRHGHGREEFFARPGMDPPLIQTITGDLDGRYPENEIVLGLNLDAGVKAWPLKEVHKAGGVVNDALGELSLVVFAGPSPEQITMAAFDRKTEDRTLTFVRQESGFIDQETSSSWSIEGIALKGPLQGSQLTPLRWQYVRWHAWFYPHRSTELYLSQKPLPIWPETLWQEEAAPFSSTLNDLAKLGNDVRIEGVLPHLSRPHECDAAVTIRLGGDRLNLYRFTSSEAAQDYVDLQGAYFCHPIAIKLGRKFSRRRERLVIESDPDRQYEGPSQYIRLPDPEIQWSRLVEDSFDDPPFGASLPEQEPINEASTFMGLLRHIRKHGYDIVETAFLPHSQLRPGVVNAIAATINADRFAIYRCTDANVASQLESELPYCKQVDRWVFRSTPTIMFEDPCYEMGQLCEEETRWSPLFEQQRFLDTLNKFFPTQ